ncbi:tetratricopeptide repeat protein [Winogradskyella sp.]|uniref:tetratricopeptide repeat protein n=1 Tax=Winogradskyella sp. TaxID=1883156 RepID=UPI003BAAEB26
MLLLVLLPYMVYSQTIHPSLTDSIISISSSDDVLDRLEAFFKTKNLFEDLPENSEQYRLKSLNTLTDYLIRNYRIDSAIVVNDMALKIQVESHLELMVETYNNAAQTHFSRSYDNEGYKWSTKALELANRVRDTLGKMVALNDMGMISWKNKNLERAKTYLEESLSLSEKQPVQFQPTILSNLGLVYVADGMYSEAIALFKKALQQNTDHDPYKQLGLTYNNLGYAYDEKGDLELALRYYDEAYSISKSNKDIETQVLTLGNLARIHRKKKQFTRSREYLDMALKILEDAGSAEGYANIYMKYYKFYEDLGQYERAIANLKLFHKWRDSVRLAKDATKLKELQYTQERMERQNEILSLTQENLIQQNNLNQKNRTLRTFVIVSLIVILLIVVLGFIYYRRSEIRKQNLVFDAIAKTEIEEQHRIARDLHDSIGAMLVSLKNYLSLFKPSEDNEEHLKEVNGILSKTIEETRRISHNMMPEELVKFGLVSAIENILDTIVLSSNIEVVFEHDIQGDHIDKSKELHIYRIVQELIQNTIKHSNSNYLKVAVKGDDKQFFLNIADNGIGFDYDKVNTEGYGLRNIQSRVNYLKGKMIVKSAIGKGTRFRLQIPI